MREALLAALPTIRLFPAHRTITPDISLERALETRPHTSHYEVAAWLRALHQRGAFGAFERMRRTGGPGGAVRYVQLGHIIDVLRPEDIPQGPQAFTSAGVEMAAANLNRRLLEEDLKSSAGERVSVPAEFVPTTPFAKVLCTPEDLKAEGRDMAHCVGGYWRAVKNRECTIVRVIVDGDRATAEVAGSWSLHVVQFQRAGNIAVGKTASADIAMWAGLLSAVQPSSRDDLRRDIPEAAFALLEQWANAGVLKPVAQADAPAQVQDQQDQPHQQHQQQRWPRAVR